MNRRINFSAADADRWRELTRMSSGPSAPTGLSPDWYRIANEGGDDDDAPAVIDIYGEISPWGVNASDFVANLRLISAETIELHINSGGGSVYEALAIYNALIDHPANVTVHVDGIAASAASFIAQAGDRVVMGRNSELMIHDGIGMTMGNAALHREMADLLDKASDNIAAIYAGRAGRVSTAVWRQRMRAETWYSAQEAVDAGLADEAVKTEKRSGKAPSASLDLSRFNYAGRANAPAPSLDETPIVVATAAPVHHTDTEDGTWDAAANEKLLPASLTVDVAKAMYGWYDADEVDGGEVPKSACKLPHHEVDEDGTPGAANLAGVRSALARLPQSDIPEAEHEAVRKHLQAHLDDADDGDEEDEDDGAENSFESAAAGWERLAAVLNESGYWDRVRQELSDLLNEAVSAPGAASTDPATTEDSTGDDLPVPPSPPLPLPPDDPEFDGEPEPEPIAAGTPEPLVLGNDWSGDVSHLLEPAVPDGWANAVSHLATSRAPSTAS